MNPDPPSGEKRPGSPARAGTPPAAAPPPARVEPRSAFRAALARYKAPCLAAIRLAQGASPNPTKIRPAGSAEEITDFLDAPAALAALITRLPTDSRLTLTLLALTETTSDNLAVLSHAIGFLGARPDAAFLPLLELGLLALDPEHDLGAVDELPAALERGDPIDNRLRVHPAVLSAVRTTRPGGPITVAGEANSIRESDGLEPILRLGALWQRVGVEPLRQTQNGTLFKRDRERLDTDPVLSGTASDALSPLNTPALFWLALARHVGLIELEPTTPRLDAAAPQFWNDNAVHLPHMIALAWMSLQVWRELPSEPSETIDTDPSVPYLRPALLLWLAELGEDEWIAIEDLSTHLTTLSPGWDSLVARGRTETAKPANGSSAPTAPRRPTGPRAGSRSLPPTPRGPRLIEAVLLGSAYTLGLVRAAEERTTGRRLVQLTPLGRYVLALGPTPPPRQTFDQFLFVQPNFQIIAYRQGLTPQLVGRLSRFAWWKQIGAALELELTRESILRGLDWGATPTIILDLLSLHSQRAVPSGVVDAIRSWAGRRERVTYYASATLIEFGSTAERDAALQSWPPAEAEGENPGPVPVAERFLLIEDDRTIPFTSFRMTGSRDYRRPPEACAAVEADGISMVLDPARSDLLVEAEIARFADELPSIRTPESRADEAPVRRFVVTSGSLDRGLARGLDIAHIDDWYQRRTGDNIPPAVRLMLAPRGSKIPPLMANRRLILTLPNADLLDGLIQHPATAPWLGDRLGPKTITVPDEKLESLQKALKSLGIAIKAD
jgi:hypothetical protein